MGQALNANPKTFFCKSSAESSHLMKVFYKGKKITESPWDIRRLPW
jgi:hypothetical protein